MKNYEHYGRFTDPIDLPYIQIPYEVFKFLYVDCASLPEQTRMLALNAYIYKYFTNNGDVIEKLRAIDMTAYLVATGLDNRTFRVQNNARWQALERGYGNGKDVNDVLAEKEKLRQEKKSELNRKAYLKRKAEKMSKFLTDQEAQANLEEFINQDEDDPS